VRIAVASSSTLALPTIELLKSSGHELIGLISTPDMPQGRGRTLAPNLLIQSLATTELRIAKPATDQELNTLLTSWKIDLVVTISYGRLIKPSELGLPRHGWINLHFSLLPQYRGAAPIQRALLAGAVKTGLTVFQLDAGMDTGPIYLQRERELAGQETTGELLSSLAEDGSEALLKAITMIEKGIAPSPQSDEGVSLAPKISKEEARIDWTASAQTIDRKIRAFNPNPGAWTTFRGERIILTSARVSPQQCPPSELLSREESLLIGTGEASLEILRLKPQGKREMQVSEWLRGARLQDGECFE
jgi:methionyl-tRNA formyltransferase